MENHYEIGYIMENHYEEGYMVKTITRRDDTLWKSWDRVHSGKKWWLMFTENRFFFLVIGLLFILVLQLEEKENKIVRVVWRHPGDDVTGMAARSEKIVNTCEKVNI